MSETTLTYEDTIIINRSTYYTPPTFIEEILADIYDEGVVKPDTRFAVDNLRTDISRRFASPGEDVAVRYKIDLLLKQGDVQ